MDEQEQHYRGGDEDSAVSPAPGRFRRLSDFGALNDAERQLVENTRIGVMTRLHRSRPHEAYPNRTVRAELIRYLARGGCEDVEVTERGVMLRGAWIEGKLDLQSCQVDTPLLIVNSTFSSEISLYHAHTRDVSLNGSLLLGKLFAAGVQIDGALNLRRGFHVKGEVRLAGAVINGMFACMGGTFENPGGYAIYAAEAKIQSNVYLRDNFEAKGAVSFFGAEIGRDLQCWGGRFINPGGRALSLKMVRIRDALRLRNQERDDPGSTAERKIVVDGVLDLRGARVGALEDSVEAWPASGDLRLDGFIYDRLDGRAPADAKRRGRWLMLQKKEELTSSFRPQPFEQLMTVLRAMGHPEEARRIGVLKQRQLTKAGKIPFYMRPVHWLFGVMVGYGYWTSRALLWGLLMVTAGHFIFAEAWRVGAMAPVEGAMLRSQQWLACTDAPNPAACWAAAPPGLDYEVFSPTLYSIDVFLPIVEFGQEAAWSPSAPRGGWFGEFAWIWRTIQEAAGYLLSAFAVAGGARLARREE